MKKTMLIAASVLAMIGAGAPASAADSPLGKCLVDSSTGRDREAFMKWVFLALAANPSVKSMTIISDAQKTEINKNAAAVMDRLVLKDCRPQAVEALRNGGSAAFEQSFETFGRIAVTDLMSDPQVNGVLEGLGGYIDKDGWASLQKEGAAAPKP